MKTWGAAIIAIVFPIAWGLMSAWGFDKIRERRARSAESEERDR